MFRRIKQKIVFLRSIEFIPYIKLNYFSKRVIRVDQSRIIPYKNSVIDLEGTAKIYLVNGNIEIGCNKLKGSRAETYLRLRDGAIWNSNKGCKISYGSTIEVLQNALFDTGFFTTNSNTVIVDAEKISLGQDVMIGRNVVIYDSNFHDIFSEDGNKKNTNSEVIIGNHVWITSNVSILKGSIIEDNCIISSNAILSDNVEKNSIYETKREKVSINNYGRWKR